MNQLNIITTNNSQMMKEALFRCLMKIIIQFLRLLTGFITVTIRLVVTLSVVQFTCLIRTSFRTIDITLMQDKLTTLNIVLIAILKDSQTVVGFPFPCFVKPSKSISRLTVLIVFFTSFSVTIQINLVHQHQRYIGYEIINSELPLDLRHRFKENHKHHQKKKIEILLDDRPNSYR